MANTLVLIAERDSRWLDWARAWRRPQHALVVLVLGEMPSETLCDRVCAHLARVRAGDACAVLLAAGPRWDGPALRARAQTIRAIVNRVASLQRPTRLHLDSGPKDGPAVLGMHAIAQALIECGSEAAAQLRVVSNPSAAVLLAS